MTNLTHQKIFKPIGENDEKEQIILIHTSREFENYVNSLKYRYNGSYNKIPNYLIRKNGEIIQFLEDSQYSAIFDEKSINQRSIIISLENLGWLTKEPLKNHYVNWIGDIYNSNVFKKKWRDYFFWDPYTKIQTEKTVELCKNLIINNSINPNFIGHNTKINGIEKYKGVICRSNFDVKYTDINPSFDFDYLTNEIENEQ
jgi:N-acetyl-anhydromuramyl-L-alanine amidase AmpD